MAKNCGHADLPLHSGTVPRWLSDRMMALGGLIVESIVENFGADEFLVRVSDPLWFQSFGAALGMDWHSSGITTSVMFALKRALNPRAKDLGIYVCGGRGKYSRETPSELLEISREEGLDGNALARASRLCAKVDNNAVQDGFQLYQHNFILAKNGKWAVVQQGMNTRTKTARRYHWSSDALRSFVENPHTGIVGENRGKILNLTDSSARKTRDTILELSNENPGKILGEVKAAVGCAKNDFESQPTLFDCAEEISGGAENFIGAENFQGRSIAMPRRHEILERDVDLKRLGAVLAVAYENQNENFEGLMLTKGLGPRTLQSLALVSEVIYGTPSRFSDPARFSFAHGGKDGHPFPVPLKIYDESIRILRDSIKKSRIDMTEKDGCLRRLHLAALDMEKNCEPEANFDGEIERERRDSKIWGGRTVRG